MTTYELIVLLVMALGLGQVHYWAGWRDAKKRLGGKNRALRQGHERIRDYFPARPTDSTWSRNATAEELLVCIKDMQSISVDILDVVPSED